MRKGCLVFLSFFFFVCNYNYFNFFFHFLLLLLFSLHLCSLVSVELEVITFFLSFMLLKLYHRRMLAARIHIQCSYRGSYDALLRTQFEVCTRAGYMNHYLFKQNCNELLKLFHFHPYELVIGFTLEVETVFFRAA